VLGPLFRTAGHTVRTQHGVTASAGQRRGDVEVRSFLRDQAGSRSLVFDLSITHDRFGSSSHVQQNGSLSHPQDLDGPMRVAAQRKTNAYRQTYADNQNMSFLPAIMSTSNRMHGEFLRLLFLQAHRETTAHFIATGLPSQQNRSDNAFRFKRAAFYMGLKNKVGLVAAKNWLNHRSYGSTWISKAVVGTGMFWSQVNVPRSPFDPLYVSDLFDTAMTPRNSRSSTPVSRNRIRFVVTQNKSSFNQPNMCASSS